MAKKTNNSDNDLDLMNNRLDWFDEERRKSAKRLSELELQFSQQKRIIEGQDSVIKELEKRLSSTTSQLAKLSQLDEQLLIYRDELVKLIEGYDARRILGQNEIEKLRRLENETYQRELSDVRKELTLIRPLQEEMEHRRAEETRLTGLIGNLQARVAKFDPVIEDIHRETKFLEETGNANTHALGKLEAGFVERFKRIESMEQRIDAASYGLTKAQTTVQELSDAVTELRQSVGQWSENIQAGEYKRDQKINSWVRTIDEHQESMDRYAAEWVKFAEQYQVSKMAVKTMDEWQIQMEIRQNEVMELTRVEANRIKSLWDNFVAEDEKQRRTFEVDQDQRWAGAQRREKRMLEQIEELSQIIEQIEQDKDTLWRVQSAQADAMKKWPLILLEEVEKAIAHNPETRRQPALVPVREE
jgi:chromosome segregation ATPase